MGTRRTRIRVALVVGLFVLTVLATLVAVPPARATHDTVEWSRYWGTTFDRTNEYVVAAYSDRAGHLYLVYPVVDGSGNVNLNVTKYATGGPNGVAQILFTARVNPTMPNVAQIALPSVTSDPAGNLFVAWADRSYDVYVSRSFDGGQTWLAPVRVDPAGPSWGSAPAITSTRAGTLYVAWHQSWSLTRFHNITVARSVDVGTTWIGPTNVTAYGTWSLQAHTIASDSQGRLYVAYSAMNLPSAKVNVTWSDNGIAWSSPVVLNGGKAGLSPSIVVDARDRVHVIWVDERRSVNNYETIWYRRSDSRGATWTMEMPISQGVYGTGFSSPPPLAAYGDTVMATWYVFSGGPSSFAYSVSPDGGDLWYPEERVEVQTTTYLSSMTVDGNGTMYAGVSTWNEFYSAYDVGFHVWDGPPGAPTITGIVRGATSLSVSWSAPPDGDLAGYRLWRSVDGVTYELIGTFGAATTTYADPGLSNGTYWYRVTAFDVRGTSSHASDPMSSTVGKTTEERIADLEAEIASLQAALNTAQADLDAIQAQLTQLQTDLNNLQQQTNTQYADLQAQLNDLQSRLNAIQAEKATQAQSYLNTVLLIVVIVLLVLMLMRSRRMRAMPSPMRTQVPPPSPPPMPPQEMPPSGPPTPPETPPELPEDDL